MGEVLEDYKRLPFQAKLRTELTKLFFEIICFRSIAKLFLVLVYIQSAVFQSMESSHHFYIARSAAPKSLAVNLEKC